MKKLLAITVVSVLSLFLVSGNAMALPWVLPGMALQNVLDDITVGGDSSIDVTTDYIDDLYDSYWDITATGGSFATMIIELAGFANENIFGVYNGDQYVEIFAGADGAGKQAALSIANDGSVYLNFTDTGVDFSGGTFGYYVDSSYHTEGGIAHSDTLLNTDGEDHMFAYQGNDSDTVQLPGWAPGIWTDNEYILAFEDLFVDPDWDYTDFVVMVESVVPVVPEPGTLLLLGAGLIGLIGLGRKFGK